MYMEIHKRQNMTYFINTGMNYEVFVTSTMTLNLELLTCYYIMQDYRDIFRHAIRLSVGMKHSINTNQLSMSHKQRYISTCISNTP